jgi:hypothetical protein
MTTNDTYLAVFLGSKTSPRMKAWMGLAEAERRAKEQEGIAAWKAWVEKHRSMVSTMGGPLGKACPVEKQFRIEVCHQHSSRNVNAWKNCHLFVVRPW